MDAGYTSNMDGAERCAPDSRIKTKYKCITIYGERENYHAGEEKHLNV